MGDAPHAPRRRLPLGKVLWGAFALTWQHRGAVARATGLPLLAIIAVTLANNLAGLAQSRPAIWTLYFCYCIAIAWLAVTVHRMVLLEGATATAQLRPDGLKRIGKFVGLLIGSLLFFHVASVLLMNLALLPFSEYVAAGSGPSRARATGAMKYIDPAARIVALWPVARLSLIFPMIALDRSFDPIAAWRATRGHGWKLAVVVGVLPWALKGIVDLIYRDQPTMAEFGVMLVLTSLCTVIQVVALSLAYWELTQPAPPPTPPPA